MRRTIVYVLALALGLMQFAFVTVAHADNPVYITQVQISGGAGQTDADFIELFNPGNEPTNLKGYRLVKRTAQGTTDTVLRSWTQDAFIPPHRFYLWANNSIAGDIAANSSSTTTLSDNNGVAIRSGADDTGLIIDSVAWGTANNTFRNVSAVNMGANEGLYRTNMFAADSGFEIKSAHPRDATVVLDLSVQPAPVSPPLSPPPVVDTTPPTCAPITISPSPVINAAIPSSTENSSSTVSSANQPAYDMSPNIKISEILPNPLGDDTGHEAVELINSGTSQVNLDGWQLDDSTTTGQPKTSAYQFSGTIAAGQFLVISIASGRFTLNNSGDTVNLYFPDKTLAHQVAYDGSGKEGESYQNINGLWYWGTPSLGQQNLLALAVSNPEPPTTPAVTSTQASDANLSAPLADSVSAKVERSVIIPVSEQADQTSLAKSAILPSGQTKKTVAAKPVPKTTTKSSSTITKSPSVTTVEKSIDKKLTGLQDSLDAFEQESAQNFTSLSAAVESIHQTSLPHDVVKPSTPHSLTRLFIAIFSFLLIGSVGIKIFFSRRASRQLITAKTV